MYMHTHNYCTLGFRPGGGGGGSAIMNGLHSSGIFLKLSMFAKEGISTNLEYIWNSPARISGKAGNLGEVA